MNINLIAAIAEKRVIGHKGKIPWHIKEDLEYFRSLTSGSSVIMGRKTFESIGNPLPHRKNIIMTRNPKGLSWVIEVCNKEDALKEAISHSNNVFVIGGENVYKEFMPLAKKMFLTEIELKVEGDAFFPGWSKKDWKEIARENKQDEKHKIKFSFVEYRRVD